MANPSGSTAAEQKVAADLRGLTIIVGERMSGRSNLLEVLVGRTPRQQWPNGIRVGKQGTPTIQISFYGRRYESFDLAAPVAALSKKLSLVIVKDFDRYYHRSVRRAWNELLKPDNMLDIVFVCENAKLIPKEWIKSANQIYICGSAARVGRHCAAIGLSRAETETVEKLVDRSHPYGACRVTVQDEQRILTEVSPLPLFEYAIIDRLADLTADLSAELTAEHQI